MTFVIYNVNFFFYSLDSVPETPEVGTSGVEAVKNKEKTKKGYRYKPLTDILKRKFKIKKDERFRYFYDDCKVNVFFNSINNISLRYFCQKFDLLNEEKKQLLFGVIHKVRTQKIAILDPLPLVRAFTLFTNPLLM